MSAGTPLPPTLLSGRLRVEPAGMRVECVNKRFSASHPAGFPLSNSSTAVSLPAAAFTLDYTQLHHMTGVTGPES